MRVTAFTSGTPTALASGFDFRAIEMAKTRDGDQSINIGNTVRELADRVPLVKAYLAGEERVADRTLCRGPTSTARAGLLRHGRHQPAL